MVAYRNVAGKAAASIATCALVASCAALAGLDGYEITNADDGGTSSNTDGNIVGDAPNNGADGQNPNVDDGGRPIDGAPGSDSSGGGDQDGGVPGPPPSPIFVLDGTDFIRRFDAKTKTLSPSILDIENCGGQVEDFALASTNAIVVSANDQAAFLTAGPDSGTCSVKGNKNPQFPDTITFTKGAFGGEEALVGMWDNRYSRIDTGNGNVNTINTNVFDNGDSHQIAAHKADGYILVEGGACNSPSTACIWGINLTSGASLGKLGDLPVAGIRGLAYTRGHLYAFSNTNVYVIRLAPSFAIVETISLGTSINVEGASAAPEVD